ncbi:MAG: histidinol-phosphatase HisJ family protein [Lachnospiraceae bacterium]|nr:histidinol-phosphatase HisJ family protein [Lachnospiraceae bacterium]
MIFSDFHMHSAHSEDSSSPMRDMVEGALRKGLTRICFTEHMDRDNPECPGSFEADLDAVWEEISRLRPEYRDRIEIGFGIEAGMQPHLADFYADLFSRYPFDFIIASQHMTQKHDPYYTSFWEGKEEAQVFARYFEEYNVNLRAMPDFDTAAHLDYVVRYAPGLDRCYSYESFADRIDPLLTYLIETDRCLEVNTAGLAKNIRQTNPYPDVLQRYYDLGGRRITIGSDAHCPEAIAYGFDQTRELLLSIGFREYYVFRQRQAQPVLL